MTEDIKIVVRTSVTLPPENLSYTFLFIPQFDVICNQNAVRTSVIQSPNGSSDTLNLFIPHSDVICDLSTLYLSDAQQQGIYLLNCLKEINIYIAIYLTIIHDTFNFFYVFCIIYEAL